MIKDYGLKIDRRKKLFMVLDVETANGYKETIGIEDKKHGQQFVSKFVHHESGQPDKPLIYDLGFSVCDKQGNIYYEASFVIEEIFREKDLMNSCYYSNKVPQYKKDIAEGKRTLVSFQYAKDEMIETLEKYNISNIGAYNCSFDRNALNYTNSQILGRKWFLPWSINQRMSYFCIWLLACETIFLQKSFPQWAFENGFYSPSGNFRTNAEVAYNYIHKTNDFSEEHTGLEDVKIEIEIMVHCLRQNKKRSKYKINKHCWRIPNNFYKTFRLENGMRKPTQAELKELSEDETEKIYQKYNKVHNQK